MSNWTGGSLREGAKLRNSQGSDQAISKLMELGGNYRLFFRAFQAEIPIVDEDGNVVDTEYVPDLRAAIVPGRTCDYDVVGTSFIPYTDQMWKKDPITDAPIDLTPLSAWASISRVLFEAQCTREKRNAEAEAERTAKDAEQPIDQVALNRQLEAIELKYHGGKAANGKDIMPDVSPAISANIVYKVSTRVAVVKLGPTGTPDWKNAKYAVVELSKAKSDELVTLLENAQYHNPEDDYLEVGFSYVGTDKKEAGKNAKYQGIANSMSLAVTFPNEWASMGRKFVDAIVTGKPDDQVAFLRSRNRAFKSGKTPNDAIQSYKKWCATNQAVFTCLNYEDESVMRSAHLFLENHLVDNMAKTRERLEALAAEAKKKKNGEESEAPQAVEEPATTATATVQEEPAKPAKSAEALAAEASSAFDKFSTGNADAQTLRNLAEVSDGIDIADGDLGDL